MPVAIPEDGVRHQQAREDLQIAHGTRGAFVERVSHLLREALPSLLILALRQQTEHLAEVFLMKPLHLVDAPIDSPILFGKQHAVEALDNEERLLFDRCV